MAEIQEKLRNLLENRALKKAVAEAVGTGDLPDGTILVDRISSALENSTVDRVEDVVERFVIHELPPPAPITARDIASIAISQLAGASLSDVPESEEFERAYQRFVAFSMLELASLQQTHPVDYFPLGEDWLISPNEADWLLPKERFGDFTEFELWSSPSGFSLHGKIGRPWEGHAGVGGLLKGYCSEHAFEQVESAVEGLIESISRTAQWSATESEFGFEEFDLTIRYFTPITFLIKGDGRRVLSTCLSASLQRSATGNDELMDRLGNATALLSYADQVGSDPLAVSLIFAAIEALVCEEDNQPTKQIKKFVPTLLVQDAEKRKARERLMDRFYRIRCDVLHGRRIHGLPDTYETMRIIAAAVVRAVVCWRENQLRVGGETTWKELMDELNAASRKPGIVIGVPDLSELIPNKLPS